jgi:hypothetical protein
MAKGLKTAKYNNEQYTGATIQMDSQIGPAVVTWANSTSTTTYTAFGGVGGNPTNTSPRTIQVHFKDASGNAYNDGFILGQRGRKQFDVESVGGGASTRTRCTLVESGTLSAKQMYILFGYNGGGTQYATRISNRYVWTAGSTVRLPYTLGLTAEVQYAQATSGIVFQNYPGQTQTYPTLAVVEGQN